MSYRDRQEQEIKMLAFITLFATLIVGGLYVLWMAHG